MKLKNALSLSAAGLIGAVLGAGVMFVLRPAPVDVAAPPPPPIQQPRTQASYDATPFAELPGWGNDALIEAIPAVQKSCAKISATDNEEPIRVGALTIAPEDMVAACLAVLKASDDPAKLRAAFEASFQPYAVSFSGSATGTFTGYYEATLRGSLTQQGPYQTPLYGVPQNLITVSLKDFVPATALEGSTVPANVVGRVVDQKLKPYFTRREIDSDSAIADLSNVVAWVDDPVDAHVLHIQGSGQVTLPDGSIMRVGFAGHNGHVFRGLGRILIDEGVLGTGSTSMGAIRDWLKKNPDRAKDLMNQNARYIFFRKIEGDGPIGASNVALTPGRSIAVDPKFVPLGLPVWLATQDPDNLPLNRLVMAQDVGAAITGAVRGDYFWGAGEAAFAKAARMKSQGRYYILAPNLAQKSP